MCHDVFTGSHDWQAGPRTRYASANGKRQIRLGEKKEKGEFKKKKKKEQESETLDWLVCTPSDGNQLHLSACPE